MERVYTTQDFGAVKLYDGKYQHSVGPQKSMIYKDNFGNQQ